MKGIYFYFYCRRSCYLYILQDLCFYCKKESLLLLFVQLCKEWKVLEFCRKSWKGPGRLMQKVMEKVKKSPGI